MRVRRANQVSQRFSCRGFFRGGIGVLMALLLVACGEGSGGEGAGGGSGLGSGPPSVGGGGGEGGIGTAQIDRSFGTDGGTITPIGGAVSLANALAVQADGKILLVGQDEGATTTFALARYSAAGALDNSFGAGGKVVSVIDNPGTPGDSNAIAHAVALQADGRMVVAGQSTGDTGDDFALARYNADGTLDGSFGSAGVVVTSLNAGDDRAWAILIQADQKIVAMGESNGTFALARFNSDGTPDLSFDSDGVVLTDAGVGADRIFAAVLQADDQIVVAGASGGALVLARYQTNGLPDPAFGSNGIVRFDRTGTADVARAVLVQGSRIVVGVSNDGAGSDFVLLGYTSAGLPDAGFGLGGVAQTDMGGQDQINGLALHPSGKITAVGFSKSGGDSDFAVAGYTPNGALDFFFGAQGIVVTPIGAGNDEAQAVSIQADGKIVVAGSVASDFGFDFVVVRYHAPL